jgi:hypothetical protein
MQVAEMFDAKEIEIKLEGRRLIRQLGVLESFALKSFLYELHLREHIASFRSMHLPFLLREE